MTNSKQETDFIIIIFFFKKELVSYIGIDFKVVFTLALF